MPEGHTIHRLARRHRAVFGGSTVAAVSPQGRFADGAAVIDGRFLEATEAYGKHVFYTFEDDVVLHIHLGLIGVFRTFVGDVPPPTPATRLAISTAAATAYLTGPMTCRLVDPDEVRMVTDALGPDPLRRPRATREFIERLGRRRIAIGAALLEQRVIAGIGNVYRSELLFLCGLHPVVPANRLDVEEATVLWAHAVAQLRIGVRLGRIFTVDPAEAGVTRRTQLGPDERLYVYKREGEPCRRCSTPIQRSEVGGRSIWWCPKDQPA